MQPAKTAFLHYSAPPVVGGVEIVLQAHARVFVEHGYPVTIIAGRGEPEALPPGVDLVRLPWMDTQHPQILEISSQLEQGQAPEGFEPIVTRLVEDLSAVLPQFENTIVHNIFGKHFNLPLTAALYRLLDAGKVENCIAWGHDFTWTSPHSRSKVFPGYPWDLLRTYRPDITYVAVSHKRQTELAHLLQIPLEDVRVIYNGVDLQATLGLSHTGLALIERLDLLQADPALLMPVRVTQAKNIEYALRLVAALKELGCQPKLVVTGPPDPHDENSMAYYHNLKAMRQQLGVEEEMQFVYESGPEGEGYTVEAEVVGDLFRACDLLLMPSHREGFGMPVLEAGLVGLPVFSTEVPAALEIGREDVHLFAETDPPRQVAERIMSWMEASPVYRLKRRVRRKYTWQAIFKRDIQPLLRGMG